MAKVPNVDFSPANAPDPEELQFEADISDGPKAGESANHLYGSAAGYRASYTDRHAYTWYVPEGTALPVTLEDNAPPPPETDPDQGDPVPPGDGSVEPQSAGNTTLLAVDNTYTNSLVFLKNGAQLQGEYLDAYNSVLKFFEVNIERSSGDSLSGYMSTEDGYHQARAIRKYEKSLSFALRLTGDRRLLDQMKKNADRWYGAFKTGWLSSIVTSHSANAAGPSPYKCLYVKQGQPGETVGTDHDFANEVKMLERSLMYAYVFELNRSKASPAGYDYGAEADKWKLLLTQHLIPKWLGPEAALSYPVALTRGTHKSNSGWTQTYRGRYNIPGESRSRATLSDPILFRRNLTHSQLTAGLLIPYYMPKVFPNGEYGSVSQWAAEYNRTKSVFLTQEVFDTASKYGPAAVYARGFLAWGSTANYLHPFTYADKVLGDVMEMFLETHDPDYGFLLTRLGRTYSAFIFDRPALDTLGPDIGGGVTRYEQGGSRSLVTPGSRLGGSWGDRKSAHQGIYYHYPLALPFDTPDGNLATKMKAIVAKYGGLKTPRAPHYGVGMTLKLARAAGLF